jgi:phage baseplate assembly protein W
MNTDPDRSLLFGADLALHEPAGGLDLVAARGGDLALAEGNDNIVQALRLRLMVRRGELAPLGIPSYGSRLHELLGERHNQRLRVMAMAFARAAVEQDPRVKKVLAVQAHSAGGDRETLRLTLDIELITSNLPLNLVFDLRLGTR